MPPKTILVTNKTNIRYLSGFSGTAGFLALCGKKMFLFTDARYHLVAKSVLPRGARLIDVTAGLAKPWREFLRKSRVRRIGFEGCSMTHGRFKFFRKISGGTRRSAADKILRQKGAISSICWADVGDAISRQRMVKRPRELVFLAHAQRITDEIFAALKKWLRPGITEKDVAWKIEVLAHEFGADDISFPPIVGINEHTASPHHQNTARKLRRGDVILLDMGVIYRGYCSDMTRVLFTKKPTNEQGKVYELVLAAQHAAERGLKAGMTGMAADASARGVIEKAGFGENFTHSLGHGVGLDIHELPNLSQKYREKIPAGAVVTIEPGIYLPGKFGVRLEDMVVVGRSGVRNLTKSPKNIQECVIRI